MSRRKAFVRKKYFTVEDANRALPLVRAIVTDLAKLANELQQRHDTWQRIRPGKQSGIGEAHAEELEQIQGELGRGAARLEELMDELRELGVEIKGLEQSQSIPNVVEFSFVLLGKNNNRTVGGGRVVFGSKRIGLVIYGCRNADDAQVLETAVESYQEL